MMRFRCPHCQQILEVAAPTEMLLCPACELWCRIPTAQELKPNPEQGSSGPGDEPRLAPTNTESISKARSRPITTFRLADEPDEDEEVKLEIVEEGDGRRRKRRRRRRRRFRVGFDVDYWISPSLILLVLLVPSGFFLIFFAFLLHPGAGFGAFLMVGGGIWFAFIAAEDGLVTALMVLFVPFYSLYYLFTNFERVVVPFGIQCLGAIIFVVSLVSTSLREADRWSSLPTCPGEIIPGIPALTFCWYPRAAGVVFPAPSSCPAAAAVAPADDL